MARKKVYICGYCKEQIDVENEDESTFFFIMKDRNRKCFHCDCFIDYYTSKKRRQPLTVEECNKKINEYRKFEIENENSIEKKESARNLLFNYIADMYDLSYIPPYFYSKLSNVFNGKYKGLSKPVPPEDLLDMWQQKRNYLLKNAEFQRRHDKNIDGISRVWYDLSILLSRYDSYLAWKEQQKLALAEAEEKKKEHIEFVEYKDIVKPQIKNKENNKIDIYSMLNEI